MVQSEFINIISHSGNPVSGLQFLVDKVTLGEGFLRVRHVSRVSVILTTLHIYSLLHH